MFEFVRRGREIGRACPAVQRNHPQLAVYPAIAALAMVGSSFSFFPSSP